MPCRDYEDIYNNDSLNEEIVVLQDQNDRLARIACKAMTELEESGKADFLLIKDEEVREWWARHKIADAKAAEKLRNEAGETLQTMPALGSTVDFETGE